MVIVITGTSKGIGLQLAKYYLESGYEVVGCSRTESDLMHDRYMHYKIDVTDTEDVQNFAFEVGKKYKVIDVLINNAGAASMNHFMLTDPKTAERLMKINYLSGFACSRAFIKMLRKADHPRIINFSTVAVPLNLEGELAYCASKAAVESMTKVMAKELGPFKITVNAVGPAPTMTNLIANVPKEKIDKLLDQQAIKRFSEIEDIIQVINFYIDRNSDFITGQIIYLGGICK
ncbi:SDR family NAD(P)-dependent oxidoreductase [Acidaminobacter hydrogenoformans]|uniref:3-oxoacyl-[acyl-carrier protein] reductase n=1 Tax=Acidaminobacter hydrogenoformans DSM 2784 TaxID=1120920 RepID=A0A1G5RPM1_9FIRM|nr:SDR family oxidoreductase [Acidaminobacter hydrogenoformans]SCZ76062.1 3-oxoacyl-[acyl-carrier protein] reductase [Acidaminobacter hydrogenoformans DSM 2784]